jgi:hypothetical protein
LPQTAQHQIRIHDLDDLVRRAAVIWHTQSKQRAMNWLTNQVRRGRNNALLNSRFISRENQLLTLSRSPTFKLEEELEKFANDIADL